MNKKEKRERERDRERCTQREGGEEKITSSEA